MIQKLLLSTCLAFSTIAVLPAELTHAQEIEAAKVFDYKKMSDEYTAATQSIVKILYGEEAPFLDVVNGVISMVNSKVSDPKTRFEMLKVIAYYALYSRGPSSFVSETFNSDLKAKRLFSRSIEDFDDYVKQLRKDKRKELRTRMVRKDSDYYKEESPKLNRVLLQIIIAQHGKAPEIKKRVEDAMGKIDALIAKEQKYQKLRKRYLALKGALLEALSYSPRHDYAQDPIWNLEWYTESELLKEDLSYIRR